MKEPHTKSAILLLSQVQIKVDLYHTFYNVVKLLFSVTVSLAKSSGRHLLWESFLYPPHLFSASLYDLSSIIFSCLYFFMYMQTISKTEKLSTISNNSESYCIYSRSTSRLYLPALVGLRNILTSSKVWLDVRSSSIGF